MNPKQSQWVWSAGGVALALGAGVMIGRISSSGSDAADGTRAPLSARDGAHHGEGGMTLAERVQRKRAEEGRGTASRPVETDLKAIFETTSRLDRTQKLLAFLDRLPTEQFASVYEEFRNMPGVNLRGSERSLILQAWAERDPHSALGFLQEKGAEDWERETTVATWAANDPQAAFAWAQTAQDEGDVNNWLLGATRGIAATDPELARDFLAQLEGRTREQALDAMRPYVMQYGFDYAAAWISGMGDEETRNRVSRNMARDLAEADPAQAAQWNNGMTNVDLRRDVSETVGDRWAARDLTAALDWVESLPPNVRSEAAEGPARRYARQDPEAAAKWLASLGNDPDLDGARQIFIEESFRRSPQTSLEFVSNLSDQRAQIGVYQRYLGGWMRRDENAARQWLNSNAQNLPPQVVARFNPPPR
jgi:hypothetical protein